MRLFFFAPPGRPGRPRGAKKNKSTIGALCEVSALQPYNLRVSPMSPDFDDLCWCFPRFCKNIEKFQHRFKHFQKLTKCCNTFQNFSKLFSLKKGTTEPKETEEAIKNQSQMASHPSLHQSFPPSPNIPPNVFVSCPNYPHKKQAKSAISGLSIPS